MYTEVEFRRELNALESAYRRQKPGWYKMRAWGVEVGNAWTLYSNAKANNLGMLVLGGEELRDDDHLTDSMGTTAANPVNNPRGTTSSRFLSGSNTKGSILKERRWWPMINDAWVIGGLHGLAQFHLAQASVAGVADDILWEEDKGRPRVLGREIIGMFNFGYIRVAHAHEADLGIVFGPHNAEGAKAATFTNYLKVLGNVSSAANIRNMMDPHVAHNNFRMPV